MNLDAGSTINGFPILHEGTHDNKRDWHKNYAINKDIFFLPRATEDNQNCMLTYTQINNSETDVKYYLSLDLVDINGSDNHATIDFIFIRSDGKDTIKTNVIYNGKKRKIKVYKTSNSDYTVYNIFVEVFITEQLIAKCNNYIYKLNGKDFKTERDYTFLTKTKPLYGFPITSKTEVNCVYMNKVYKSETFNSPITDDKNIAPNEEFELWNRTMNGWSFAKLFAKICFDKVTVSGKTATVKIYRGDMLAYTQEIALSNVIKTIQDIFYVRQYGTNEVLKVTITNNSTENISLIASRTIFYLEQ